MEDTSVQAAAPPSEVAWDRDSEWAAAGNTGTAGPTVAGAGGADLAGSGLGLGVSHAEQAAEESSVGKCQEPTWMWPQIIGGQPQSLQKRSSSSYYRPGRGQGAGPTRLHTRAQEVHGRGQEPTLNVPCALLLYAS